MSPEGVSPVVSPESRSGAAGGSLPVVTVGAMCRLSVALWWLEGCPQWQAEAVNLWADDALRAA